MRATTATAALLALLAALVLAACSGEETAPPQVTAAPPGNEPAQQATGGTLVFGAAADPVVLDAALVSDPESLRVVNQIFEGLVRLRPGTVEVEPALAERWEISEDGRSYTFHLREDVEFHDGELLDAEAVCFNFDRWHTFRGELQSPSASYYWQAVFGGFKDNERPDLPPSLYRGCEPVDETTATINLTRPYAPLLSALALPAFSIASPEALQHYQADEGTVDAEGVFHPTGTYGTEHPTGTGPFELESWERGDKLVLVRNERYWGEGAKLHSLVFLPLPNTTERREALEAGEIHGYDDVAPWDTAAFAADEEIRVLNRAPFNVAYVGINQTYRPLERLEVRRAIAHALDRDSVVATYYRREGVVAKEFLPPPVGGYAGEVREYGHDPARAKRLLRAAGLSLPVRVRFCYPTGIARPYMPYPRLNFEAFRRALERSGFAVEPRAAAWSAYVEMVDAGECPLYLLGWTGRLGDADDFLGTLFAEPQRAWGFERRELHRLLEEAERELAPRRRERLYREASRRIMELLPGVPYAHVRSTVALRDTVEGFVPSPLRLETFAPVSLE